MALSALDYADLQQLLNRYSHTLDFGDIEGFIDCFTEDAVFSAISMPLLDGAHRGHDALRKFARTGNKIAGGHIRHSALSALFEEDGAEGKARSSSYFLVTRDLGFPPTGYLAGNGGAELVCTGLYIDKMVKQDGKWRFRERTCRYDAYPDVLARVNQPVDLSRPFPDTF